MLLPINNLADDEVKAIATKISKICVSSEFQALRKELEKIYEETGLENASFAAFYDALYTLLSQDECMPLSQAGAY